MLRHTIFSAKPYLVPPLQAVLGNLYKDTANMRGKSCKYKRFGYSYLPRAKLFKINYWIGFLALWLCRTYVTIWNTLTRKKYVHLWNSHIVRTQLRREWSSCLFQEELLANVQSPKWTYRTFPRAWPPETRTKKRRFLKSCLIARIGIVLAGGCWSSAGTMTGRFSSRTIKSKEWVAGDAAEAAMFL